MRFKLPRASHLVALLALATTAAVVVAPGAVGARANGVPLAVDASTDRKPLTVSRGLVNVVVTLADPSVAVAAKRQGLSAKQQRAYTDRLEAKQSVVSKRIRAVGGYELARVTAALNAIALRVHPSKIDRLKRLQGVARVRPINDYELDLAETVPYIGAAAAQAAGIDGTGIDIAILDSGIDYTHESFGGPGTAAAYEAAYGTQVTDARNTTTDGLFPTAKVVAGFDYVGEFWPGLKPGSTPPAILHPDPDPIDCGTSVIPPSPDPAPPAPPVPNCAGGHGSHVADIAAGIGPSKGVAPGAKIFAYKVCSATSTSCNGVAMLQGVNAALDPNGDGSTADRVDVMNLSIGSPYGQVEDDISLAFTNATRAGIVVVASAGNSGDRPYITGSGATSPDAISVAQTHVPSAVAYALRVDSPASIAGVYKNTNTVDWAPITTGFSGTLKYGATAAERLGCDPYPAGFFAGTVALIDRGVCAISIKVDNAADAGATGVVVVNNLAGAAPSFSFGGPATFTPAQTIIVGLEVGTTIKGPLAGGPVVVTVSAADATPLVGSMVSTSSRGPSHSFVAIKPDIGAPGASLSVEAGTGTGETAFGGTSGAAPMVTGSAALLLDKTPSLSVSEVKSLLMNTAETNIQINPFTQPGVLAEITRIGAGEVRVDRALASGTAAWAGTDVGAGLSFGYHALSRKDEVEKRVTVKNYGSSGRWYTITPSFRYANDAASGAVDIDTPSRIWVPGRSTRRFEVELEIDPRKLPIWADSGLNGGATGGDGFRLASLEFDGYISINGGTNNTVHVAWHVLPHRAADVEADESFKLSKKGTARVEVENDSRVLDGRYDLFALTGTSPRSDTPQPAPGSSLALIDLRAVGVREVEPGVIQFGIDTFGSRSHPVYPAEFDILIDRDNDGDTDVVLFTLENGTFASTGQTLVFVDDLATPGASAFFFADAELNSGNMIMTAPMSAIGITSTTKFSFSVEAFDNYFTGQLTDSIGRMTHTLATPKFTGTGLPAVIPARDDAKLNIASVAGGDVASPSQTGFLLMYRDASDVTRFDSRNEADLVQVKTKKRDHDDDD
jgi:subtilisin family serine protease